MNTLLRRLSAPMAMAALLAGCRSAEPQYVRNEGYVFGTTYHYTYAHSADLGQAIALKLRQYDASLSTFNRNSIISRVNRNEDVEVDTFFVTVFRRAQQINRLSGGAYDLTVAPLLDAWGFGFANADSITPQLIDSLMQFVGMDKIDLDGRRVVKADSRVRIEACSLAEGYGVDVAASVLDSAGVTDYMVEIGGEVHVRGRNPKGELWHIAVDKPIEGSTEADRQCQLILGLTDCAVSTSGSYRNFYYKDGKRLSHTIDPTTGHPIEHGMLSVTVVGPNTMTTDALSTTMMVMGPDSARNFAARTDGIEAFFIYGDSLGNIRTDMTPGFEKLIVRRLD